MPFDIPFADDPWNEIRPGLFQGGHDYVGGDVVVRDEFDLVVSLYRRSSYILDHGPPPDVEHLVYTFPDAILTAEHGAKVVVLAARVANDVLDGKKVLVRCQAGYNRSGLVVALALKALGMTGEDAVDLIHQQRSPWALCNTSFVRYIIGVTP
jgi:protein-tyrosine phosphatase